MKYHFRQNQILAADGQQSEPYQTRILRKLRNPIVFNPICEKNPFEFIEILRMELLANYTRIDFAVYPDKKKHASAWWVNIEKNCFIRPSDSTQRLYLVEAINIPFAPAKYYFKNVNECLPYTLIFPSLPRNTQFIDIIEKEGAGESFFNFYNVSTEQIKRTIYHAIN